MPRTQTLPSAAQCPPLWKSKPARLPQVGEGVRRRLGAPSRPTSNPISCCSKSIQSSAENSKHRSLRQRFNIRSKDHLPSESIPYVLARPRDRKTARTQEATGADEPPAPTNVHHDVGRKAHNPQTYIFLPTCSRPAHIIEIGFIS